MPRLSISILFFLFPLFGKARAFTFSTRKYLRFLDDPSGEYFFPCYERRYTGKASVSVQGEKMCIARSWVWDWVGEFSISTFETGGGKEKNTAAKERKMEVKLMYAHLGKQQTPPFSSFTSEWTGLTKQLERGRKERKQKAEEEETLFFTQNCCVWVWRRSRGSFSYKNGGREWHLRLSFRLSLSKKTK